MIGAHEHRAVPAEAEADAAVPHGHTGGTRDDLQRRIRVDPWSHRHPQPAAIEAHAHRLGVEAARWRRHEENLGQCGHPNRVAAYRPESGPHAGTGTHAVAFGERAADEVRGPDAGARRSPVIAPRPRQQCRVHQRLAPYHPLPRRVAVRLRPSLERHPHGRNPKPLGQTRDDFEDRRIRMDVLMGIEMCQPQARAPNSIDLRRQLLLHLG